MRVWVASLIFYFTIYAFCGFLRLIIQKRWIKIPPDYVEFVLEFIGTVNVCAPMFDVNIVLENYGLQGVAVEILFIEFVNALVLRDAVADPCPLILGFLKKQVPFQRVCAMIGTQFAAAYFSFILVSLFWKLGIHSVHSHFGTRDCESDLAVTILYGSLVEAGGCLAAKYIEHYLDGQEKLQNFMSFISAGVASVITVLGIHLTGMYANPIVAWACTFNCGDVPHLAHFLVYWIAPLTAWIVADRLISTEEKVKQS